MLSRELLSMATQTDLIEQIDWKSVECLNAHPDHGVNNALKQVRHRSSCKIRSSHSQLCCKPRRVRPLLQGYREDDGLYLESDTDEQLLLHISFQTGMKMSYCHC